MVALCDENSDCEDVSVSQFLSLKKKTVQILPVKKKSTREKNQIFARENEFTAREKTKKSAREKKMGVKKLKIGPKSGRENNKVPVKKSKKRPKMVFTGTFFSRVKKKHSSKRP